MTDDRIERARALGQANRVNFRLVENWCAHIRIERQGGVGMVEEMTGDPIGLFGPACDHAGPDGMMSWDIRDAAVDFYDRHCRGCGLRRAVRDPNLSQWVAERDAQAAAAEAREAATIRAAADALEERRKQRRRLRVGLTPGAVDVVDQLDELDGRGAPELVKRFAETARLASEAFPDPIRAYLFELLEADEIWAEDAALAALSAVGADPPRLARAAAAALRRGNIGVAAVSAFVRNRSAANSADIAAAFPALVELSAPERQPFTSYQRARRAPLVILAKEFPNEVKQQIGDQLTKGLPSSVSLAARAIDTLAGRARTTVSGFTRELVSTLVRAKWLPAARALERGVESTAARDLEVAVIVLFRREPRTVDDLMQKFLAGASDEGETRVYRVYRSIMTDRRFRDTRPSSAAERMAFSRLLRAAPRATNWDVLNEITQAVHDRSDLFLDLAQDFADELLGTAIMMDERLVEFDAEPKPNNLLEGLERNNRRGILRQLRDTFVAWAAAGVAASGAPAAYVKVLENVPEARDGFGASMIENAVGLATTAIGFNAILPALYSGLVGASVLRRGAAATAVGNLPANMRRHAPDLLFEAFIPALTDPYVYVHRSALFALRDFRIPEVFDGQVRDALANLVRHYGEQGEEHQVIIAGIEILVGRYLNDQECAGGAGAYLVRLLDKLPQWSLASHMHYLARKLGRAKGFIDLLISILTNPESNEHTCETILEALADFPNEVLYANRAALAAIPAGPTWETRRRIHGLVELLSRAEAWNEVVQLAERATAEIPDTRRELSQRRLMELATLAARYELALASDDPDGATAVAAKWRDQLMEIEKDQNAA